MIIESKQLGQHQAGITTKYIMQTAPSLKGWDSNSVVPFSSMEDQKHRNGERSASGQGSQQMRMSYPGSVDIQINGSMRSG